MTTTKAPTVGLPYAYSTPRGVLCPACGKEVVVRRSRTGESKGSTAFYDHWVKAGHAQADVDYDKHGPAAH